MSERKSGLGGFLKVSAGIIVGAAAGVVAGLLIAPKKGTETLEDLKEVTLKFKDDAEGKFSEIKEYGDEKIAVLKNQTEELFKNDEPVIVNNAHTDLPIGDFVESIEQGTKAAVDTASDAVEDVVDVVKDVAKASSEKVADAAKVITKKVDEVQHKVEQPSFDDSTESLLARIQGVTADNLDD